MSLRLIAERERWRGESSRVVVVDSTVTLSEQLGGVALAKDEPATAPAAQEDAIATSVQADGAEITVTKEVPASKSSEEDDMKVD